MLWRLVAKNMVSGKSRSSPERPIDLSVHLLKCISNQAAEIELVLPVQKVQKEQIHSRTLVKRIPSLSSVVEAFPLCSCFAVFGQNKAIPSGR